MLISQIVLELLFQRKKKQNNSLFNFKLRLLRIYILQTYASTWDTDLFQLVEP